MSRIMKGFDSDDGVLYIDRPENFLKKASLFIKSVSTEKEGRKAIKLVEKYSYNDIINEFEKVSEGVK